MEPLHDRESELIELQAAWTRVVDGTPELVILSGHRRVGKTYLVTHFLQSLPPEQVVYYFATQQAEHVELRRFSEALQPVMQPAPLISTTRLDDWEHALRVVAQRATIGPLAVVIDEAPYLTQSTRGFASIVQAVWDQVAMSDEPPKILLILTGSATSVMEEMSGPKGPLRGRPSKHLRMRPFDFPTVAGILDLPADDAVSAYAFCGGWPLHVNAWDSSRTTKQNLIDLAGTPGGILLEDAETILRDLPEGPGFRRVLAAIGRGRTRYSEIESDADQRIDYPLDFLTTTGLVRRETPVGAPRRARPLYVIGDAYLRFWFEVIYGYAGAIRGGQGRRIIESRREQLRRHRSWVFEEAAREHARRLVAAGAFNEDLTIGRWWSASGQSVEVDVVGLLGSRTALVGEVKWSAGRSDPRWIGELAAKLEYLPDPVDDPVLCLWTRGETPDVYAEAGVQVYGPEDLTDPAPGIR